MNSTADAPGLGLDAHMAALKPVLERLRVKVQPVDFMSAVANAYRLEQGEQFQTALAQKFRQAVSFPDFAANLRKAVSAVDVSKSLAVGCGYGLAGASAEFAASTIREVAPTLPAPAMLDLKATELNRTSADGPFDLIATHSLLHFIADLPAVFEFFRTHLSPKGVLVLGHEPNAHFWNHPSLEPLLAKHRSRRFLGRLINPATYLRRTFKRLTVVPFHERVNIRLREELGMEGGLTSGELAAILDPHLPSNGTIRLGLRGFDWEQMRREFLPEFRILFERSSDSRILSETVTKRAGIPGAVSSVVFIREGI